MPIASGPEHAPRAAATFELSVALRRATGDGYFAQHAFVQLAEASQHSAVQPSAAQHSQSAHDVQSHSGQSAGQQQQPPPLDSSAATLPLAAAGLSPDSPASIATITIKAANTAT